MSVRFANIGNHNRSIPRITDFDNKQKPQPTPADKEQVATTANDTPLQDDGIINIIDSSTDHQPPAVAQNLPELNDAVPESTELIEDPIVQDNIPHEPTNAQEPTEGIPDDEILARQQWETEQELLAKIEQNESARKDELPPKPSHDTAILEPKPEFNQESLFSEQRRQPLFEDSAYIPQTPDEEEIENSPLHEELPSYRESMPELPQPEHTDQHAKNKSYTDNSQLVAGLSQIQNNILNEIQRNRTRLTLWIPAVLCLLLFGLCGWLLGEMDSMQDRIKARTSTEQKNEDVLQKERERFSLEREKMLELLRTSNKEKKRLENEISELMIKNEMLRKSMLGLPGPELGVD